MANPKFKIKHSITKKEWNKTHKDFKSIIDGIHYVMKLTDKGTALVPVNITESINEVERGDMGYVEKYKSIATVYGVMGKKLKVKLGKTGKEVTIDSKDIRIISESVNERMVEPKRGHYYYQLTKDNPIKYIKGKEGMGLEVPGVLIKNNDDYIDGKKGAYLIDYFGALYYVDMKKKFAKSVYPLKNQDKFNRSGFVQVDMAPEHSDWKKYLKEDVNEAYIVTYAKKKGEKPASAAFQLRGSALSFERDLKKDGYITMVTQKKVKGIDESINEANPSLNKKVKQYLDTYLRDTKKNSPEHQESIMLIMRGALSDANFHSEARELKKYFPKAKETYIGTPMEDVIEDKGVQIAKWAKWDGYDIIDAFAFYTSMTIGGSFGAKFQNLKESIDESVNGMSKQQLDSVARGMFGKSYSRLTMDQAARLKYYLSQSKNESVNENQGLGKLDAKRGKDVDDNPFKPGTKQHVEWLRGFEFARARMRARNEASKIKMNALDWGKSTAERNSNMDKYDSLKTDKERQAFLRKLKSESINEGKDPEIITQLRDVVKNGYKTLKDPKSGKKMKVDTYSASAIVGVYDKLSPSNKEKFVKQGLLGMQSLAFKFIK